MPGKTKNSEPATSTVRSTVVPNEGAVPQKAPPLYLSIHTRLSEKIAQRAIPQGTVIKEGPLASIFGVSRAPVRRALHMLEQENRLKPAKGQGFIVGNEAEGAVMSPEDLQSVFLDRSEPEVGRTAAWELIYDSVRLDVTNCLPFGTFQVNESLACEHFAIGRTGFRDALGKLQDQGFLEKSTRSHWIAGPLTARDVHEAFEVRRLLEPEALVQSVLDVESTIIRVMREKVGKVLRMLDGTPLEDVEDIENDLHQVLLEKTKNKRLLEAIDRNQFPFIINRIFRRNFGLKPDRAALEDHAEILDQLLRGRSDVARSMLDAHLAKAEMTTLAKLRVLSTLPKPVTAPYLINMH